MIQFKGIATFEYRQGTNKFKVYNTEGGVKIVSALRACLKCGSDKTKKKLIHFWSPSILLVLLECLILISCDDKKNNNEENFTPSSAMEIFIQLSPIEGAKFFKEKRADYVFLDKLYGDSIVPALRFCSYYELKNICKHLKETPYYYDACELYQQAKDKYTKDISEEITQNTEFEMQVFKESILPAIELEIDSMLEEDVKETMSQYAGGDFLTIEN